MVGPNPPGRSKAISPTICSITSARTINSTFGPGFDDVDFSLEQNTTFHQRYTFQIRSDAFNLMNHPNFGQPLNTISIGKGTVTAGNFGRIVNTRFPVGDAGSSRQLQLTDRFIF